MHACCCDRAGPPSSPTHPCVHVFMLDCFLPPQPVSMSTCFVPPQPTYLLQRPSYFKINSCHKPIRSPCANVCSAHIETKQKGFPNSSLCIAKNTPSVGHYLIGDITRWTIPGASWTVSQYFQTINTFNDRPQIKANQPHPRTTIQCRPKSSLE